MPHYQLLASWGETTSELVRILRALMRERRQDLQILEAGCGRKWLIDIGSAGYRLTGVDLDPEALRHRVEKTKDLHYAVVGDLRDVDLPDASYDAIYSAFVLEHVPGAARVLKNFARWLKPGGRLLMQLPNPYSVYGYISRKTPHWFHVMYYRKALKIPNAGKPGFAPYPTVYDRVLFGDQIERCCADAGLILINAYQTGTRPRPDECLREQALYAVRRLLSLASFGSLSPHDNLLFVIKKPEVEAGTVAI